MSESAASVYCNGFPVTAGRDRGGWFCPHCLTGLSDPPGDHVAATPQRFTERGAECRKTHVEGYTGPICSCGAGLCYATRDESENQRFNPASSAAYPSICSAHQERVGGCPLCYPERSAAQDQKLAVRAEMWTRKGEWQILVRAPEWVVDDFARQGSMSNGRRVWVHNFGGGVGGYSFLLGTVEVESPTRRERFARWLLRVPMRRFATH